MTFAEKVDAGIREAMKGRDQVRLASLRLLKAALTTKEVEKGRALDDAESLQVVASLAKQRRESIEQFTRGNRPDLVEKERADLAVLESLMPPPLTDEEMTALVDTAIADTGAASAKDIGKVMKAAMAGTSGRSVDGKRLNELVRARLTGGG
jgi:uncharacterized protein YqeY